MRSAHRTLGVVGLIWSAAAPVQAFYLTEIHGESALGEPLVAWVEVFDAPTENLEEARIEILPALEYANNPEMMGLIADLGTNLVLSDSGRSYIEIKGSRDVGEPIIALSPQS